MSFGVKMIIFTLLIIFFLKRDTRLPQDDMNKKKTY